MVYVYAETPTTNAVYGTPVIDGQIDAVWASAQLIDCGKLKLSDTTTNTGVTASARTLWDETHLYILLEVNVPRSSMITYPSAYEFRLAYDNEIEILDPNNRRPGG